MIERNINENDSPVQLRVSPMTYERSNERLARGKDISGDTTETDIGDKSVRKREDRERRGEERKLRETEKERGNDTETETRQQTMNTADDVEEGSLRKVGQIHQTMWLCE
jgi:hypothetical protein